MKKRLKKIPRFKNEDQERRFWNSHSPLDYEHGPILTGNFFHKLKPSTILTSLRMPAWLMNALRGIANKKDIPAQSLMKLYLSEKVEEELRGSSRR